MLERPDLSPPVRTINMIRLGEALTTPDAGVGGPPVSALIVYNSNPAAVAPDRNAVLRGMAREDLFTVVLEHFQTDTADYADIVLPATTQLEHWDIHTSYGHHYVTLNQPAIEPLGEALPNSEIFRRIATRMGLDDELFRDDDVTLIKQVLATRQRQDAGRDLRRARRTRWMRLNLPTPYLPFADGEFLTPSGKCEFYSERMKGLGLDPLPMFIAPYEFPEHVPELAAKYPLTLISSPAHQFLNTTFVNIDSLRRAAREPECLLHPADAERRGIGAGARVRRAQRPRRVHRRRAHRGHDSRGRGVGAVHLVGQVRRRWSERQSDDVAARDRHGARAGVLRQSGRGWAGGLTLGGAGAN